MGIKVDGSSPTRILSRKRALTILEYECQRAIRRGDDYSYTNLRALMHFISEELEEENQ